MDARFGSSILIPTRVVTDTTNYSGMMVRRQIINAMHDKGIKAEMQPGTYMGDDGISYDVLTTNTQPGETTNRLAELGVLQAMFAEAATRVADGAGPNPASSKPNFDRETVVEKLRALGTQAQDAIKKQIFGPDRL